MMRITIGEIKKAMECVSDELVIMISDESYANVMKCIEWAKKIKIEHNKKSNEDQT